MRLLGAVFNVVAAPRFDLSPGVLFGFTGRGGTAPKSRLTLPLSVTERLRSACLFAPSAPNAGVQRGRERRSEVDENIASRTPLQRLVRPLSLSHRLSF